MNIIKCNFSNNSTYPIILEKGLPNYLFLRYTILYQKNKSYRTKYIHCKSYTLFHNYISQIFNQSIDQLIIENKFNKIIHSLKFYSSWLSDKTNSKYNHNIYLDALKNILLWASSIYSSSYMKDFEIINGLIKHQKIYSLPKKNTYNTISKKQLESILKLIDINSISNPFIESNRLRNLLIFLFFIETGIRKSELLKIKIKDIKRDENQFYLHIMKDKDDNEETRKNKQTLKNDNSYRFISISLKTYLLYLVFYKKYISFNYSFY